MKNNKITLSIIIPAYNEEDNITEVIERIENSVNIFHELVVVNDHSRDRTREIVTRLTQEYNNLVLVDNVFDPGFANAIKTGFNKAAGEAIIPVMGDLCDDLSTIKLMFDKINEGYDIICGSRYVNGGRRLGGSKIKAFLSYWGGVSLHYLLGVPTHDIANAFKMYRKEVINSVDIKARGFDVSMELPLKGYFAGFKMTEVPTIWKERTRGQSSFKVFKLLPSYLKLYVWALKESIRKRFLKNNKSI